MSLTIDKDIPPIFNGLLEKMQEKQQVTIDDFRNMLYSLRISEDDIKSLEQWFIQKGIITRTKGYVILTLIQEIKE